MECIKDFLDDSYQHRLRLLAQSKTDRYEDTIENYKKIFLAHLDLVKQECTKSCLNCIECKECRNVILNIKKNEIESFFDELKKIYLYWIDSNTSKAISCFTSLLRKKDLFKFQKRIGKYDVFFKGRFAEQVLTAWDMFHIPFNRRYLIQNQRYSLTGQPMLYIGSSVIDIAQEIGIDDVEKLKLSVVTFIDENLKIYDLRSNILDILDDIWLDKFLDFEIRYGKADFFKMILASVCSFQKRQELKNFNFCEEYVIPQLLALVLKNNGFDGVAYYSTKRYENVTYEKPHRLNMAFKENMAIFTKLNTEHVYDKELFRKLFISVPIDKSKIYAVTIEDLKEIKDEINQLGKQDKITSADSIFSSFERIYGDMEIDGIKYQESEYGKIHMYEIYTILNQILVD